MSVIPAKQVPPDVLGFQASRSVRAALYAAELNALNRIFGDEGWRMAGIFPAWDDDGGNIYGVTTSATYTELSSRSLGGERSPWHLNRWGGVTRYSRVDYDSPDYAVNFWFGARLENMDLRITIKTLAGVTVGTPLVLSRVADGFASGVYSVSMAAVSDAGIPVNGPRWDLIVFAEWKTQSGSGTGYLKLGPVGRTLKLEAGDVAKIPRHDCSEWSGGS